MNKIEVKPTTENVINMLEKNLIGRNQYISNFLQMLDNVDDNFTIFLNGDWGTGKTFLVKQINTLLIYYNKYISNELEKFKSKLDVIANSDDFKDLKLSKNFVPIYYNAWNNDSHIDPINSIIFNIIKEHNILKNYQKESSDVIGKIASVLDMANIWSNGSIKELVSSFKGKDIVPEITTMENLKDTLNMLLNKLLVENGDKLVVFVDELDRCNPIYAVKLLERIKHFFDHENIIFVFSVNMNELANTISNFYGQNFDSHRYLNKFFDVSIDLPKIDITNFMKSLGLEKDSTRFDKIVFEIIEKYHFSMRDCIRYYQSICIVEDFAKTSFQYRFSEEKGKEVIKTFFLPILLAIKIIDLKSYIKIINGQGCNEFINFFSKIEIAIKGIENYMNEDENGEISKESFKRQLTEFYDVIFNHKGDYKEYSNEKIELDRYSYNYLMDVLSLLKKGLNYS